jgi:adenylate cyclase
VLLLNVIAAAVYTLIIVPTAIAWGLRWTTYPAGGDESAAERNLLLAIPMRMVVVYASVWIGAAVLLVVINLKVPWLAATLGISALIGGTVTTAVCYWMSARVLRSHAAAVLTDNPPTRRQGPGLRIQSVGAWVLGTGVPLLMLLLVGASALYVEYSVQRLAAVVLVIGGCALVSGLAVAILTGAISADPINEVRRGMQRVERGNYDVSVPVFDASELGLLQAGFNTMASGLRERERLRDLFGRHVGRDVAQLAEESVSKQGAQAEMGGVKREVAVLFVDVVGSTRLATQFAPEQLVSMLNDFFGVVVEVVERHKGLINKFEGDAVLAIFGAPVAIDDFASYALAAARELHHRLSQSDGHIEAGIGVSAGMAVAGNVGDPSRYEYTVIGDPVNEAARLTEVAKGCGGVVASGAALTRARRSEAQRWHVVDSKVLRGRDNSTEIAVPRR